MVWVSRLQEIPALHQKIQRKVFSYGGFIFYDLLGYCESRAISFPMLPFTPPALTAPPMLLLHAPVTDAITVIFFPQHNTPTAP
jgi:hypothetical protein